MMSERAITRRRMIPICLALLGCFGMNEASAQSVAWPTFGPQRQLLRLDGFTDTVPDFVGPIDGSAELTIFTEGNHYPVLLPLVFDEFPRWCEESGHCHVDPLRILVVTLPQPMIVGMLREGGARLGNAILPVQQTRGIYPNLIMAGQAPLRQLAARDIAESRAVIFARHRGLGLLVKKDLAEIDNVDTFTRKVDRLVVASQSEPGARTQYQTTLTALVGAQAASQIFAHEVRNFPGRLGIQHRDVPYAILNDLADGGIIFAHLASFYAHTYPDRLSFVAVPTAEPFGQDLEMVRAAGERGRLTAAFEKFFIEAARTAYPAGGFSAPESFAFGTTVDLKSH